MSKIKVVTINPTLHQILLENKGTFISIKEIKEQFSLIMNSTISSEELTKVIYRQLLRLTQNSIVEKQQFENSKYIGYKMTKIFDQVNFKYKKFKIELEEVKVLSTPKLPNKTEAVIKTLNNQLTQYEVDFQSSIAESEEYKHLFTLAPEMKVLLETHFIEARNKSNQLLGKITAVKNIIGKLELNSQLCN